MYVYADNAATTKMSAVALNAMMPYMTEIYGNPSSLHSVGQEAKEALEDARARVAKCLGCEPREIYFTSGGSEADNQAIISAARFGARKGKKHIISTAFEHHAVLHTLQKLEKEGFEVTYLDVKENHNVSARQVRDAIREDTCLVTTMYANNEIGSILPIAEIGAVCKEAGVVFHTDAVQAVGHLHIDVKQQNIDMLSLSGHKFHGPKGVGALYVRRGLPLVNIIDGGAQERGKRAGTENIPAIMGMAAALEDAVAHLEENTAKVSAIRDSYSAEGKQLAEQRSKYDRFLLLCCCDQGKGVGSRGLHHVPVRWPAERGWDPGCRRCRRSRRRRRCRGHQDRAEGIRLQYPQSRSSHCRAGDSQDHR
jgi:cysteine desulfurase